jgi:hypothetical protein
LALKDHLLKKKDEINHSVNFTTLTHFTDNLLQPFATATNMCQGNAATVWEQILALDLLLAAFNDTSAEHQAAREVLAKRSYMLVSPAVFVIAWLSPSLPRSALSEDEICVAMRYHEIVLGESFRAFSNVYKELRGDVSKQILSRRAFLENLPKAPADASTGVRNGVEATNRAIDRLLDIAPTEASVERVFSAMKLNANRLRTRLAPSAAAAQVIFNEATAFNAIVLTDKNPDEDAGVRPSTFRWIVQHGAANFEAAEEEPEISDDICAVCKETHDDAEGHSINGRLYLEWWVCVRCARWYGVSCLGISPSEFERRKGDNFECMRFQSCKNKPAGYICDRYKKYAADVAKRRRK